MGAVRCILNESGRCFVQLGDWFNLTLSGSRKIQSTPLRYCMQGNVLYLPRGVSPDDISFAQCFCWARLRTDVIDEQGFGFRFDEPLPEHATLNFLDEEGVGLDARYMRRHKEIDGKRVPAPSFCSATLIEGI